MNFIKKLFLKKEEPRKTGIFINEEGVFLELDESPGNGSVNSIIEHLNYHTDQIHSIYPHDSKRLSNLAVKIFTKEIVFFITKDEIKPLNIGQIKQEINSIDWDFEYSSFTYEDILNEGIENKSLNYKYLSDVLDISSEEGLGMYFSEQIGYYLYFRNNILIDFDTASGLNSSAAWLKNLNEEMFQNMLAEAIKHQDSKIEALNEVNTQCEALQNIPNAVVNKYVPEFTNKEGNINFYNIYVKYYSGQCNIEEFLKMNKGRYRKSQVENGIKLLIEGKDFIFNQDGYLQK